MLNQDGYIATGPGLPTDDPNMNTKLRLTGLSKTVKFLGILDVIFSLYYSFTIFWPCIFLAFLSWCGYYGAKKFKANYIMAYIICICIYTILKGVFIYYSGDPLTSLFSVLSFIVEIYLLTVVCKFYKDLKERC